MTRPLVSVITPTWQRAELLAGCIENVRAQTYRPLEHVIISDGPDDSLVDLVRSACYDEYPGPRVGLRPALLGRNWSTYLPDSFCAAPTVVGMLVAAGDYQTWLADDERMEPDHIASLVEALDAAGAEFAYSKVRMHAAGRAPSDGYDIGSEPPRLGQITNVLYRADLLKRGLYPFGRGMTSDWACVARWLGAGATWAFVDRVTLTHRYDH